jgi:transposase
MREENTGRGISSMTISGLQIRHILKTYHKSVRFAENRVNRPTRREGNDWLEVPFEGRKRQIRQKAANHVLARLTRAEQAPRSSTEENP